MYSWLFFVPPVSPNSSATPVFQCYCASCAADGDMVFRGVACSRLVWSCVARRPGARQGAGNRDSLRCAGGIARVATLLSRRVAQVEEVFFCDVLKCGRCGARNNMGAQDLAPSWRFCLFFLSSVISCSSHERQKIEQAHWARSAGGRGILRSGGGGSGGVLFGGAVAVVAELDLLGDGLAAAGLLAVVEALDVVVVEVLAVLGVDVVVFCEGTDGGGDCGREGG